ncbi:DUF896 domain-containing protein [Romboutsia sedimentorum]|uniref:UPF0291 protein QOZ84_04895 n=1 Tax=Romboutsia sedimentorum TaxID=1368474 RepID=A0ABT7E7G3_9FIRM|nr:DUF896 domain-containing protein [Romboutsia sedimentorum]MDK2562877.1 DUF896 domain-containing protein [Romboutsia sedimentorum]MDK2585640.1 DUF896 domain-containing protein [Romboutsia sedimentorum]
MFDQKKLDRINELAKKNKAEGLSDAEIKEREGLRKEYLDNFRAHFRSRLDNVKVVSPEEYDEYMKNNKENNNEDNNKDNK